MATIGNFFTVGSCVQNLPFKFGNRTNLGFPVLGQANFVGSPLADGSMAITAVLESIKELTETYEFEELKYQTSVPPLNTLQMSVGNGLIPISTIMADIPNNTLFPTIQAQSNWLDITDVYTFWIWFSGNVNQAGRTLKYRRVTTVDNYSYGITSNFQGNLGTAPPVYYTRFGNALQVGPYPDQNYNFFVRVKLRHPFPVPFGGAGFFTPAQLSPVVTNGQISNVLVNSSGVSYPPNTSLQLIFSQPAPGGTAAVATASTSSGGQVNLITIVSQGSGYVQATAQCNTAILSQQQVMMPDSWQEIVEIAACKRLALWTGATEFVAEYEADLQTKISATGVMTTRQRLAQMERDERHNERQLSLRVARYTHA